LLPDAEGRRVSAYLQEPPLSEQVDIDETIGWLKRRRTPQQFRSSQEGGEGAAAWAPASAACNAASLV
jgi:hypothetical protein